MVWSMADIPPKEVHARIRAVLVAWEKTDSARAFVPCVTSSKPQKTVAASCGSPGMFVTRETRIEQSMM